MPESTLERLPSWRSGDLPIVDLLDRLLECGAVIDGDLVVSVAGVDLIWLGLRAVIGGIDHAPPGAKLDRALAGALPASATAGSSSQPARRSRADGASGGLSAGRRRVQPERRIDMEPDRAEQGLVRLVMSVVELLRQLIERQALRRVEDASVSEQQIEELGMTLMRLEERMGELKEFFGLRDEDLELRLTGANDLG